MWLEESRDRLDKSSKKVSEAEILEYLASALYQQGNLKRALQITDRLSMIAPDHPQAKSNIQWYEEQLEGRLILSVLGEKCLDFAKVVRKRDCPIWQVKQR
jgi:hypothetical protein